ncbi:MAG: YdjY domain-containing protein [Acidobacteriota bacterium]
MRQRTLTAVLVVCLALAGAVLLRELRADTRKSPPTVEIDSVKREIRFKATAHPSHLSRKFVQPGHHAIVWSGGRARFGALFESAASDHDIRVALRALGASAGENLTEQTWTARSDLGNPEPDKRVEGSAVDVFVEWPGSNGAVPLSILILENGKPANFDFRFGGNERYQKDFKSGCIVCDYSCPGGAIGNHNRTIRDEERLGEIFTVNSARVPKEGTVVTIVLRPRAVSVK